MLWSVSRGLPLANSQQGNLPATAHWLFSFYSKPYGSLLRTSEREKKRKKNYKGEWGEGHLGKTDYGYSECSPHPAP